MTNKKIVSIIIPLYNAEKYISQTIESVLGQTHQDWELIIVDDGSTDQSLKVVQNFIDLDKRIKVVKKLNGGASSAKQEGLKYITGNFVQYLDADDILTEDKLNTQVNELLSNSNKVAVCKTAHFFNGDNHLTKNIPDGDLFFTSDLTNDPIKFLINLYGGFTGFGSMIQPNAFLIPTEIIKKAGPWDTSFSPCPDEDGEYFCRIILSSEGIIYNEKPMNFYRKFRSKNSLSGIRSANSLGNLFKSESLKFQHLLNSVKQQLLIPKIHTAYYKSLFELEQKAYPINKSLSIKISNVKKKLNPDFVQQKRSYGGKIANFIGNSISWKLLTILQHYKSKLGR